MQTIPRMTRIIPDIDTALQTFANSKDWTISFAIAKILANSSELSKYLSKKNKEVA